MSGKEIEKAFCNGLRNAGWQVAQAVQDRRRVKRGRRWVWRNFGEDFFGCLDCIAFDAEGGRTWGVQVKTSRNACYAARRKIEEIEWPDSWTLLVVYLEDVDADIVTWRASEYTGGEWDQWFDLPMPRKASS